MDTGFLEVSGITKSFGGLKAVSDVTFTMKRNEIIGLIGPACCRAPGGVDRTKIFFVV